MDEALVKELTARLEGAKEQFSDANIRALIVKQFEDLSKDPAFRRKIQFGADEKLSGSKFARWGLTGSDVEFLHDIMQAAHANGQSRKGPSEDLLNGFQAISDAQYIPQEQIREMDKRALDDLFPRIPKAWLNGQSREQAYNRALVAMDTAESGAGQQLVGAQYVRDLWEAARNDSVVFGLIDTFEMQDATVYLPVEVDIPEMIFVGENTAFQTDLSNMYAAVNTGSQRVSVSASKFVIHQIWSGEMEEDAIIPFVPFLRRQAALSIAHYSDSLILNGDTTNAATGNINLDDADPADTKHYLAFDGVRHAWLVDNTANGTDAAGAATLAKLMGLKSLMVDTTRFVDWGHPTNMEDLVYVTDVFTADKISQIDEVLKAKWALGMNAQLLNGEVGRILGHPVVRSMAMSKTEADGKVSTTGGNNTLGQVCAFNRRGFKVGWRRRVKIETERMAAVDQNRIVYSLRLGMGRFTPTGAASGIEAAAGLYNINIA